MASWQHTVKRTSLAALVAAATGVAASHCGGKDNTETSEPPTPRGEDSNPATRKPIVVEPQPTATAAPAGQIRGFWSASADSLTLRRHDTTLKAIDSCDLASSEELAGVTGGVTALNFIDKNTLLAIVDPGASGERIVYVDVSTSPCTVRTWFPASSEFQGISSTAIVPFPIPNTDYLRVFVGRPDGADRFTWNRDGMATRATGPGGAPFVAAAPAGPGGCAAGTITGLALMGEAEARTLLLLSSGEGATRLNVVGSLTGGATGNPQCLSSHDYGASGLPTNSEDRPVQAIQASDKRIYVLFQNRNAGGKIIRYDFNGQILLSPYAISQDSDDVGYEPKAIANPTTGQLLVATGSYLTLLDSQSGKLIRRASDTSFTPQISALAVEP